MARKDNYKSKWLAALSENQSTGADIAVKTEFVTTNIEGTQYSINKELSALHMTLCETGSAALSITTLMDECRDLGFVKFKEIEHNIDSRISQLPSKIIARRTRDVLKMAEERIGVLTAICEDLNLSLSKMYNSVETLGIGNRSVQQTAFNTLLIGKNAKENEIEDYMENPRAFHRNSEYRELPEDWSTLLTQRREATIPYDDLDDTISNNNSSDGESISDHDNSVGKKQIVKKRNHPANKHDLII